MFAKSNEVSKRWYQGDYQGGLFIISLDGMDKVCRMRWYVNRCGMQYTLPVQDQNLQCSSWLWMSRQNSWSVHSDILCLEIEDLTQLFMNIHMYTHTHTRPHAHTQTHTHTHAHTHTNGVRSSESASQFLAWEELGKTLFGSGVFVARRCDRPLSPLLMSTVFFVAWQTVAMLCNCRVS